jgi:hypothetical protein
MQLSKGFAVAMQGAMANQTARGVSDRLLKAEKAKGAHMNSSLNSKDRLLHDLQAQVSVRAYCAGQALPCPGLGADTVLTLLGADVAAVVHIACSTEGVQALVVSCRHNTAACSHWTQANTLTGTAGLMVPG